MGNNKPIDKLIVQKVFEMIRADKSHSQIADFFHHSRQWVQHVLANYSPKSCSPISVRNRGPRRKTTREEDQLIIQKAREKAHAPVRAVLGELNSPTKKKISRRTAARRLNEAGARTLKAVKDQLTSKHKAARVEWANIRIGDLLNDPDFFKFVLFSDEVRFELDPLTLQVGSVFILSKYTLRFV